MAVALDATGTSVVTSGSSPVSFNNLTVGSGANRALLVFLTWNGSPGTVAVAWDSSGTNQSCAAIGSSPYNITTTDGVVYNGLWGLVAPTSGNKTLQITFSSGTLLAVDAMSFTGANQAGGSTTFANVNTASGLSSTLTLTVTATASDAAATNWVTDNAVTSMTQTALFGPTASSSWSVGGAYAINLSNPAFQNTTAGGSDGMLGVGCTIKAAVTPNTGVASLSGAGALNASAFEAFFAGANLSGAGLLKASDFIRNFTGANFAGVGLLNVNSHTNPVLGSANFNGAGALNANGYIGIVTGAALFNGAGALNANGYIGVVTGAAFFGGAGALNANGYIGSVTGAASFNGAGLLNGISTLLFDGSAAFFGAGTLLASTYVSIPELTLQQLVYVPPTATFINSNVAPVFVGQNIALFFGNSSGPIPPDETQLQMLVTKPDGSQLSIGFPLCFIGEVDIPFKTTSNFLYYPALIAGNYCVGQVYGSEISQSGNWTFQLFSGTNKLSQPVSVFVNPR